MRKSFPFILIALAAALLALTALTSRTARSQATTGYQYISPRPGAQLVSACTSIALRNGEALDPASLSTGLFHITGSESGAHAGAVVLSDDGRTAIFRQGQRFTPGESVLVTVDPGLRTRSGALLDGVQITFTVSKQPWNEAPAKKLALDTLLSELPAPLINEAPSLSADLLRSEATSQSAGQAYPQVGNGQYFTVPADFPIMTVTVPANNAGDGYLFLSNFSFWPNVYASKPYLLILDNNAEPVFYRHMTTGSWALDFKVQPDGHLTYWDSEIGSYYALDSSYQVVDNYYTANCYYTDVHELQVIEGNHALMLSYDNQTIDMSQIVPGGYITATVTGLIVQEVDSNNNVVLEWRSWDHIPITDTVVSLTRPNIDYVHGNAVDLDSDGNLLISSRNLNEVTKIDRDTGEIIWRLGGKQNDFTFLNLDPLFAFQHDIRRLANGNITIFDNSNTLTSPPPTSRALELRLDETNLTAELVWQYMHDPIIFSPAMGNVQRLPNMNTLVGWGSSPTTITEVHPDGSVAFEMMLPPLHSTYRSFRFVWEGAPVEAPDAIVIQEEGSTRLYYSYNGATNIASYFIYGGSSPTSLSLIAQQPRTGFEDSTNLAPYLPGLCFFRVQPIDNQGRFTRASELVSVPGSTCTQIYLPVSNLDSFDR